MSRENRSKRREFLRQSLTGAALAGFAIVPRHVPGGDGYLPPSEKLNIAGFEPPAQTIPGPISHAQEWLTACKTGSPTGTHWNLNLVTR